MVSQMTTASPSAMYLSSCGAVDLIGHLMSKLQGKCWMKLPRAHFPDCCPPVNSVECLGFNAESVQKVCLLRLVRSVALRGLWQNSSAGHRTQRLLPESPEPMKPWVPPDPHDP